ncbi:MAG: histidine phosphatase family protein [Victivallaceae bacterium]
MLKLQILTLLILVCFDFTILGSDSEGWENCQATIFVTRHGQTDKTKYYDPAATPGSKSHDPILTPLGREQALLLGQHLKSIGFKGRIYASPYKRTLETASIVAKVLDSNVYILSEIHEYVRNEEKKKFEALTIEEIRKRYPMIARDATLENPWLCDVEKDVDVEARVKCAMKKTLHVGVNESVLYITHAGIVTAFYKVMKRLDNNNTMSEKIPYNCTLSIYKLSRGKCEIVEVCDQSFLPDKKVTYNAMTLTQVQAGLNGEKKLKGLIKEFKPIRKDKGVQSSGN